MKTNAHILALSWNIATEPSLYRKLAPNPYTPTAQQIISERFPLENTADIVMAIILAEPEGRYDREFRDLSESQQKKELFRQKEAGAEVVARLGRYIKKQEKELRILSKEDIYDNLSLLVFGTADVKEIEICYSQEQRRDLKLFIFDHIENLSEPRLQSFQKTPLLSYPFMHQAVFTAFYAFVFVCIAYGSYGSQIEQSIGLIVHYQTTNRQIATITSQKESQRFPVRLKIPKINVDALIEYVGVTAQGAMEVPKNTRDVGFFGFGSRPGEKGSAVIAGHLNGENGEPGVFTDLSKLKNGDKLYIEDDKGAITSFVVRSSRIYDPGYADEVFARSNSAHLNLITCDGVWNEAKKSYSKRLVVFADITP